MSTTTREHTAIEWYEWLNDDPWEPGKPLTPFCAACTDPDLVAAIEFGDMIELDSAVVDWPCEFAKTTGEPA
jgi:hypothetical protein